MDNIRTKATEHGNYAYNYDDLYRLTDDKRPATAESYAYDQVGNRLQSISGVTVNWTYNQNNELQNYDGVSFQYDANGNLTKKTGDGGPTTEVSYEYDLENRLIRVEDGTGKVIAKYEYDPFGRRLWKEVDGTKQYFIYYDEGLAGELDQNGSLTKTYGYRPNSTWTTDSVFMREGESYYYYHNDHLGTPQKLTAQNGQVVWSAKYSAFGEAVVDPASTIANNLRFPGQYYDEETQLHYNYFRDYDPRTGRYITADPIGLQGGINVYAYVGNNPINWMDFYGLISDEAFYGYNRVTVNQNHPPNVPIVDWYPEQRTRYTRNVGHLYPTGPGEYPVGISAGTNYPARPMASPYTLSMIMCMTREMGEGFTMSDGLRTEHETQQLIIQGIPAAPNGNHMGRAAVDIAAGGNVALQNRIMCAAAKCGFTRCKRYPGKQVHVDMGTPSPGWSCPNPSTCNARCGPAPYARPNTPNMGTL
jgi:RHS repeat-associated protein